MSINPIGGNSYSTYGASNSGSASASPDTTKDINFSNGYQSPSASSSGSSGAAPKSGGIGGFFKGIFNGAKNAVKSLATPKGLLMAGAGIAACIAFPVAAPLILGGVAVAAGGSKMYQGVKNHDTEQIGEGFFTAGAGAAGAAGTGAVGSVLSKTKGAGAGSGAADAGAADGAAAKPTGLWSKIKGAFSSKSTPATKAVEPPPLPVRTPALVEDAGSATSDTASEASFATADSTAATDAAAATTPKPGILKTAGTNLKNSGIANNFRDFGSSVKNGEGVKGKLSPFAKPAMMTPATASLTAPPQDPSQAAPQDATVA